MPDRILIKPTLADLPKIRDRYPFIYLEHGRLEIDDASVKWISADREVFRLPAAMLTTLLLGPGTSITHEAVKVLATLNTTVCWVGEDSLRFYAVGHSPTADTRNLKKQLSLAFDPKKSLEIARRMFSSRFPDEPVTDKSLKDLMMMEGRRVQSLYTELANRYLILWRGRSYEPGKFELSDITNQLITSCNSALYALILSMTYSLGLSPHTGFVHSGSPLPFVYDVADLYKADLVFDLAFSLTPKMAGNYNRHLALEKFRERVIASNLLVRCPADIFEMLGLKS